MRRSIDLAALQQYMVSNAFIWRFSSLIPDP